jgi:TonB family protein
VGDVSITEGLNEALNVEAVRTVRQWTFTPGQRDGKAVPVQVEIEMTFTHK